MIDLDELEKKCKASPTMDWHIRNDQIYAGESELNYGSVSACESIQDFIAAANPQTILSLIKRVRAAEGLEKAVDEISNNIGLDALTVKFEAHWPDPNNVKAHLEQSQTNMERWFTQFREALTAYRKEVRG